MHQSHPADTATFAESGAPPWWLRALVVAVCAGWLAFGAVAGGADGAAGAAMGAAIVGLGWGATELGQRWYGGIVVDETALRVGTRRQVALSALDLSTLRDEAGMETYAVFGERNLRSAPMWRRETVAVEGRDERGAISVVLRTDRRAELVDALVRGQRCGAAAPPGPTAR